MSQSHRACCVRSSRGADRGAAFPKECFNKTSHQVHGGACRRILSPDHRMHGHSKINHHVLVWNDEGIYE